jgi:hypothetical protein
MLEPGFPIPLRSLPPVPSSQLFPGVFFQIN